MAQSRASRTLGWRRRKRAICDFNFCIESTKNRKAAKARGPNIGPRKSLSSLLPNDARGEDAVVRAVLHRDGVIVRRRPPGLHPFGDRHPGFVVAHFRHAEVAKASAMFRHEDALRLPEH